MRDLTAESRLEKYSFHPMVSIIIPVYNGANYMREAIDSSLKLSLSMMVPKMKAKQKKSPFLMEIRYDIIQNLMVEWQQHLIWESKK